MNLPEVFPELATERLVLRELGDRDVQALFTMYSDARTMRYWSTPPAAHPTEIELMLERGRAGFSEQRAIRWGLARRTDDWVIGSTTLFNLDRQNLRAEIGYMLSRDHWGRGLMREALAATIGFGFGVLELHRIEADIDPRNTASVNALQHFGFTREGLLRERWRVGDEVSDSLLLGLLRSEWERRGR